MGNLFGRKKVSRVTEHDKAVLQVKQQRDKLKQYQQRIEKKIEAERDVARKLLHSGQRDRAKLLLKKKRYQEALLAKADGQLDNLDKMIQDLEFAQIELQVVDGLKIGNESLKKLNDLLDVDEIENILEETKEGYDKQQEINSLLSGQLSPEDLEEVEKEYEDMISQEEESKNIKLPDVPVHEPHLPDEIPVKTPRKERPERIAVEAS